jgi:hypothetical protein
MVSAPGLAIVVYLLCCVDIKSPATDDRNPVISSGAFYIYTTKEINDYG